MTIKIQLAQKGQATICLACIKNSDLWTAYFENNDKSEASLNILIAKKQIYIAVDAAGNCIGFMGVIPNGCFREFTYLSLLAVRNGYRGRGVGKALMAKFEELGFAEADKIFLLVSDFNVKAQGFYQDLGYKQVGNIPDLFKAGVSENLLVKYKR